MQISSTNLVDSEIQFKIQLFQDVVRQSTHDDRNCVGCFCRRKSSDESFDSGITFGINRNFNLKINEPLDAFRQALILLQNSQLKTLKHTELGIFRRNLSDCHDNSQRFRSFFKNGQSNGKITEYFLLITRLF